MNADQRATYLDLRQQALVWELIRARYVQTRDGLIQQVMIMSAHIEAVDRDLFRVQVALRDLEDEDDDGVVR